MSRATIELRQLAIGYQGKKRDIRVAENLNAVIHSGTFTCLIGANGVGKSTLLRTLSAFQSPLAGEILIEKKNLSNYSDAERAKWISVVLTEKVNVQDLSVAEMVGMGRLPYTGFWGVLTSEDHAIIEKSLEQVHISAMAHRSIQTLSDGERQKVMIAKALAQETPIIFLDEPTAFLDFSGKVEILKRLYQLSKSMDKTIFLSTHDIDLALQIADTIWLMDKEKGLTIGTPQSLAEDGSLENFFRSSDVFFDKQTRLFKINTAEE
jgi:iron complex transport system ATP-binding protein